MPKKIRTVDLSTRSFKNERPKCRTGTLPSWRGNTGIRIWVGFVQKLLAMKGDTKRHIRLLRQDLKKRDAGGLLTVFGDAIRGQITKPADQMTVGVNPNKLRDLEKERDYLLGVGRTIHEQEEENQLQVKLLDWIYGRTASIGAF